MEKRDINVDFSSLYNTEKEKKKKSRTKRGREVGGSEDCDWSAPANRNMAH